MNSRRRFLTSASLGVVGASIGAYEVAPAQSGTPPGEPSAFATSPPVGPEVSAATFVEAEKLMQVELSSQEIHEAAGSWREAMAPLYERRTGPRKIQLEAGLAPASRWEPNQYGQKMSPRGDRFVRGKIEVASPCRRCRHCFCASGATFPLDRDATTLFRAAHADLP